MSTGKVSVNSDAVNQALAYVVNSYATLEGDVQSKLPGKFQELVELGFISTSLTKIQDQVKSLMSTENSVITSITQHLAKIAEDDQNMGSDFQGGYQSYGGYTGGGGSGSQTGSDIPIDTVEEGKQIKKDDLVKGIPELEDSNKLNLIKFIDINKNEKTKLIDLLFDTSKSEELYTLLKNAFKDSTKEELSLEDYKEVQKVVVKMLLDNNIDYPEINTNSVLIAKDYLKDIATKNNIKAEDLLLDSKYSNVLKQSLMSLYDGNGLSNVSQDTVKNFRSYIDKIATENNTTYEEVLSTKINLIL